MNNPYPPPGPEEYGTGGYSPDPSAMGGQPGYGTPPGSGAPTPPPGYGAPSAPRLRAVRLRAAGTEQL